jgi:nicotinate-nucleotide adenylyltransferase
MKVAVYGGSFNPPHVGHGMVAAWLGWTKTVDAVWFMPTGVHAFGKTLLPFVDRLAMCEALAKDVGSWVGVTDIERDVKGTSYSIDSLVALRNKFPEHSFRFVVGADVLPDLPKWKDWEVIEREFHPIIVGRDGYENPKGSVVFPGVSSSDIRDRLASNQPISSLVSASVLQMLLGR